MMEDMPPTGSRHDPYHQFNFLLEVDGEVIAGFSECSGLPSELDREVHRAAAAHRRAVSTIVFKRGSSHDAAALRAWQEVEARRSGAIVLVDETAAAVARFGFRNGFPTKIEAPDLNASANEVAIETIELSHEGLVLETADGDDDD